MRPGPNKNRPRNGRGHLRRSHGGGGSGGGGGGGGGGFHRNQSLDSNGPDVKLRGTAHQIFERYQILARDAHSSGDYIAAENYLQHAEHYYRMMVAAGGQPQVRGNGHMSDEEGQSSDGQPESAPQEEPSPQG